MLRHSYGSVEKRVTAVALGDAHLKPGTTLGADKGYDTQDFVAQSRS